MGVDLIGIYLDLPDAITLLTAPVGTVSNLATRGVRAAGDAICR